MNHVLEIKKGVLRGIGFLGILIVAVGTFALVAQSINVFSSGQVVSAADINTNFSLIYNKLPPVGSIQAWHKSLTGTPSLPDGWLECNGQTISDSESPYDGQTLPDLNSPRPNPAGGAANTYSRGVFLRGHATSGVFEDDSFQGHWHVWRANALTPFIPGPPFYSQGIYGTTVFTGGMDGIQEARNDGTNGAPRYGKENRPVNMSVVWIIRIK